MVTSVSERDLAGACVRFELRRKHTRESEEILYNLKHSGARTGHLPQEPGRLRWVQPDNRPAPVLRPIIQVDCAATDLKRRIAKPKNKPPTPATARNCGQTTSIPAPR